MTIPAMSVIMPVYNVEPYIEEAIVSVLGQSFGDFELVIVDDGGSDGSMQLARGFAAHDDRIRIVSQANRGLAGARNTGIAVSRGRYVALLDSDDRWHRDKLALHFIHLEANPDVGVSYAGSRMIDRHGAVMAVAMRPKLGRVDAGDILCRNPVGNGSAAVLRRSALDRAAFIMPGEAERTCWFDETFRQSEDIELWCRLAARHGVVFEGIGGLLTDYRIIAGALSANIVKQYLSWSAMFRLLEDTAPQLVANHGRRARAYQLRYLARRAVQLGEARLASDFFRRALRESPRIAWEEPGKTIVTGIATAAVAALGEDCFRRLAAPYLKAAA